jgi:ferredoxin
MIITKQKNFDELLRSIDSKPVFLVGCSECATICHTGGKDEVLALKQALETKQVPVSGWVILEPACHRMNDKRMLKDHAEELNNSTKVLVLACGNGVQTLAGLMPEKEIIAGTDTLFLGEISHITEFNKRCVLCGECLLDLFGGLCPVSQCPKSMLNGPCGGSSHGKCEINSQVDCVWVRIIQNLKKQGALQTLSIIQKPKDWSKAGEMNRRI